MKDGKKQPAPVGASTFQREALAFLKLVCGYGFGNLTCNELVILGEVWISHCEGRKLTISDVQRMCNLPKATASRVVCKLAGVLNLISVHRDDADRRNKLLLPSKGLIRLNTQMTQDFRNARTEISQAVASRR